MKNQMRYAMCMRACVCVCVLYSISSFFTFWNQRVRNYNIEFIYKLIVLVYGCVCLCVLIIKIHPGEKKKGNKNKHQ